MSPEAFLQEAEIMKKFSHPHLVAMYAVCTDQEPFYIITEFMINGALLDFLRKDESKMKLSFDSLISIAAQVNCDLTKLYFSVKARSTYFLNDLAHLKRPASLFTFLQ